MLDDWLQFEIYRRSPEEVYKLGKPEFEGTYELCRYFGLTCHPQSIGRISRLKMLGKIYQRDARERGCPVYHM